MLSGIINMTHLMHVSKLFSPPEFTMKKVIFFPLIRPVQFGEVLL